VVGAQHPLPVGQGLLKQPDGLVRPARVQVGDGEVIARPQGLGVVGAQHALLVGQGLLEQPDGLVRALRKPVLVGEVITRF
jgi:hypothetical protein